MGSLNASLHSQAPARRGQQRDKIGAAQPESRIHAAGYPAHPHLYIGCHSAPSPNHRGQMARRLRWELQDHDRKKALAGANSNRMSSTIAASSSQPAILAALLQPCPRAISPPSMRKIRGPTSSPFTSTIPPLIKIPISVPIISVQPRPKIEIFLRFIE